MAEKASNLASIAGPKPSFFEVIAEESLDSTLYPAFRKICKFLADFNPTRYFYLNEWNEELFLLLDLLLQYHYLKHSSSSFSESFYGLQRVRLNDGAMSPTQRKLSLALLSIVPYLKRKLDSLVQEFKFQLAENPYSKEPKTSLKKFICHLHTAFNSLYNLSRTIQYIGYMSDNFASPTILHRLLGLKLAYRPPDTVNFWSEFLRGSKLPTFALFGQLAMGSLEMGAFFLRFLQVWNSENGHVDLRALPRPPAPRYHNEAKKYTGKCPLCKRQCKIPTALPSSGFVFCLPCIYTYLVENQKCPVTSLPTSHTDIIKICTS